MALSATPAAGSLIDRVRRDPVRWLVKPAVWVLCLAPLGWLAWLTVDTVFLHGRGLGANPIAYVEHFLGDWALRLLLISLAVTPLRIASGWKPIVRLRRLLGLFAFFYVVLHIASYVGLDQFFNWAAIWADIVKRWYITVGMASLVCLIPLAVTSTKGWIKRIGGRNWNRLHKLVYLAGLTACVHFFMMRKGVQIEPLVYGAIFALLMAARGVESLKRRFIR